MASEFVRKVKGIRNIDILSPNITTENDLISTIDGEVYVATNKGYRKITGVETKEIKQLKTDVSNVKTQSDTNTLTISGNTDDIEINTSDIGTLQTDTNNNTSEIETLKTSTGNNTSDIGTLQTDVETNTTDIGTLQTDVETNTTDIGTLQTDVETNTTDIGTLQKDVEKNKSTDTGWVTFQTINDTLTNDAFTAEGDNGFECAYRVIDYGDRKEKHVRINVRNVSHQTVVAELPKDFAKNVQFHYVRVPINKGYGLVGLFPSGSLYVYIESDKREIWNETDYYYGEFSWVE